MKFKITLLLCSLVLYAAQAQETPQEAYSSVVTLSLLNPTFSYAPRYNVGYMHKVAPRWWVGLEAGYGNYGSSFGMGAQSDNRVNKDYRIFEVRPEVFYSLRNHGKIKHLVSAEVFYINHTDHFTNNRYYGPGGYPAYRYDEADFKRIKTGLNINYNLFFYFSETVGLIWKTGLGIKNRDVTYRNVTNKTTFDNSGDDEHFAWFGEDKFLKQSGAETNFNFNMDLKLFYKF
ncbi:hypothetical protein [Flavobacterium psychrotrophum]|uniref:hypothetical protein n=1 Tax=Flavobacterium psychrotrophum TaxID=2294119 RepID=UPI000E318D7D|nr:hypothetical protein [Flavobacterium psychrotrophum]